MGRLKGLPQRLKPAPRAVGYADRAEAERARSRTRAASGDAGKLRRLYATKRWRDLRLAILERDGWMCRGCAVPHLLTGKAPAPSSAVVDHIRPHKGNLALFWSEVNLQSVCKAWHDRDKQRMEAGDHAQARRDRWS